MRILITTWKFVRGHIEDTSARMQSLPVDSEKEDKSPLIQRAEAGGANVEVARRVEMVALIAGGMFGWVPCEYIWYAIS